MIIYIYHLDIVILRWFSKPGVLGLKQRDKKQRFCKIKWFVGEIGLK